MTPQPSWHARCEARKKQQRDEIPKEWLISLPHDDHRNVMQYPLECGLLSAREIEITETVDIELLLQRLATAEWSSLEVTTAFYKRAIIAHQLVRCLSLIRAAAPRCVLMTRLLPDKLSH